MNEVEIVTCSFVARKTNRTGAKIASRKINTFVVSNPAVTQKSFAFIYIFAFHIRISFVSIFTNAERFVVFDHTFGVGTAIWTRWLAALAVACVSVVASAPRIRIK